MVVSVERALLLWSVSCWTRVRHTCPEYF